MNNHCPLCGAPITGFSHLKEDCAYYCGACKLGKPCSSHKRPKKRSKIKGIIGPAQHN